MPDYNLGRAHGTIKVDYDGKGVRQADEDLTTLGRTTEHTSQQTSASLGKTSADYDTLAAAAKRLEGEVTRAAAAEVTARARATAAQEHLVRVQNTASASSKDLLGAQRELTKQTKSYEDTVMRARTATRALEQVRGDLAKQQKPDLDPHVNTSTFDDIVKHLKNIDKNSRSSVGGLNTFQGRLFSVVAALAVASPSLASLGVALVSLTGLVGVAAGALVGLAAVGGTLATAFSGIGAIFKAAGQQSASAGSNAAQSAQQQRAAAQQIVQAVRGVRDAEENLVQVRRDAARGAVQAGQQVIQAERTLRDAQLDALRAQEDLTKARRDAQRQLEDLRSSLVGGALDERQAIIDVQRAQDDLNKTLADPRSSALDKQQAVLSLDKQKQALEDVRTANARLGQDSADAAKRGVDGSNQVVDAQLNVVHAHEAAGDAAVGVAEAVVAGAQQQIDAQISIRNATEAVGDAQRALADAYASAATAGQSGASAMQDALANVSPQARALAQAVLGQSDAWKQVKFAVQDALFAGLSKEVQPLATQWLPLLKTGMVGIATELHGLIIDIVHFLEEGQTTRDVATIFDNIKQAVHNLEPGIVALLRVFLNLSAVGSGFLPQLATGFSTLALHLADVAQHSRDSGEMQSWMKNALTTVGKLWELLGNVASIIGTIFSAFGAEGGDTLSTLIKLTQALDDFLKSAEGQTILHSLGKILAEIGKLIAVVLIGSLKALAPAFATLAPVIIQIIDLMTKEFAVILAIVGPLLQGIAVVLSALGPILVPLIASFLVLSKAVGVAKLAFGLLNDTVKANPFILLAAFVIAITILIIEHWTQIKDFLAAAWEGIKAIAELAWDHIKSAIIDPIINTVNAIKDAWTVAKQFLSDLWESILSTSTSVWEHIQSSIVDPIQNGIENVISFFRDLPGTILDILAGLPGQMWNLAGDIIQGLLNGLKNVAHKIIDFFRNLISDAVDTVMNFLGIGSPSKLFRDIGEFTLQGYLVGINDMEDPVVTRMVEVAGAIATAGTPPALVPAGALPAPRSAPDSADGGRRADGGSGRPITIGTLALTVAGNLDPTDRVQWRKAIKQIKKDIEDIDRSDQP